SNSLGHHRSPSFSNREILRREYVNALVFQTFLQNSHDRPIDGTERQKHGWLSTRVHGLARLFELDPVFKRDRLTFFRRDLSSNGEFAPAFVGQLKFRLPVGLSPNRIRKSRVQHIFDRIDLVQGFVSSVHPYFLRPPFFSNTSGLTFQAYSEPHSNLP